MVICPQCGHDNIPGVDDCEQCGASLGYLSQPQPRSPIEQMILRDKIEALGAREPLTVSPDTPVSQVLEKMVGHHVGCVMICEGNELVGIFSERDALRRLGDRAGELGSQPISEFMTPGPETVCPNDKVAFALHKMDLGGYRHIPVVGDEGVLGIISVRDVLKYVSDNLFEAAQGAS